MRRNWLLGLVLLQLWACRAAKVGPQEAVLFPDPGAETWWLWSLDYQRDGRFQHLVVLVGAVPAEGGTTVLMRMAGYDQSNKAHTFSGKVLPPSEVSGRLKWPLVLALEDGTGPRWEMHLDRRGFVLSGALGQEPFTIGSRFTGLHQLAPRLLAAGQNAWLLSKLPAKEDLRVQLMVLHDMEALFAKKPGSQIVYLESGFDKDRRIAALLRVAPGGITDLGHALLDESGEWMPETEVAFSRQQEFDWVSPNRKTYSLGIQLEFEGRQLLLLRAMEAQEFPAGRASCWMGATEMMDMQGANMCGTGNMVILSH